MPSLLALPDRPPSGPRCHPHDEARQNASIRPDPSFARRDGQHLKTGDIDVRTGQHNSRSPVDVEQALDEILGYARALQVEADKKEAGLFWHGFEMDCGNNGQLWARGNGWALMGLVETLTLLPEAHPDGPRLLFRCSCH